jgi:predicted ATPase/class 3 adenylate cyclase
MTLPTGPGVTFLFTDIEGSTRLEHAIGSDAWAQVVGRHDRILRTAIEGRHGIVVKTEGDAFFAGFASPQDAVEAAVAAQRGLAAEPWPAGVSIGVRMGLHLGEGRLRDRVGADEPEDYVGIDVNYAARITAAGNGGQVVLSSALAAALPRDLAAIEGLDGISLIDEGLRTVKDFDEPRPLFRLVIPGAAEDARALRTTEVPTNLPGALTRLVGREAQVAQVRADLDVDRLVTLTGPGGSGKTRLALAVAAEARQRFPHGVWLVDLAGVRNSSLMVPAIAATLDVRESSDRTVDEVLRAHLRDRTMLLVLDNLEQLLPEAADRVVRLLRDAPQLRVLVTSRELLRVSGERGRLVPPLGEDAGVALFLDRARDHRPDLLVTPEVEAVIHQICARLGGLPLAIELAAARTRLLAPAAILERLGRSLDLGGGGRDLPERQRTLRGAVAWSYELLSTPEQRLFSRLAVFASGFEAEAALPVADPDGQLGIELLEGLESLADKSLLRIERPEPTPDAGSETRFSLHPLLREYGLEQLSATGERATMEARFAQVCLDVAERTGAAILGPAGAAAMSRLDREHDNIRAAVEWALPNGDAELGLRIMAATWRWFQQRGRLREARSILAALLAEPSGSDTRIRIAALAADGGLAYWVNDFAAARAAYLARLELATGTGDPELIADAHYDLGFLGMVEQNPDELQLHEARALQLYSETGNQDGIVRSRQGLVLGVFLAGDYRRACELETQNLDGFRAGGSRVQVADSLTLLSAIYWRMGDPAGGWARVTEALGLWFNLDSAAGMARVLGIGAIIQLADGDAEEGARIAGAVYRLVREKGVMLAPVKVLHLPDPASLVAERVPGERGTALMAEGDAMPLADMVDRVLALRAPG